jgi:hypothetical protein
MKKTARRLPKWLGSRAAHIGGGALLGGGLGTATGYARKANPLTGKKYTKKQRRLRAVGFGLANAIWGGLAGDVVHQMKGFSKYYRGGAAGGFRKAKPRASFQDFGINPSKMKTKAEYQSAFRRAARKHHPDLGGSTSKMQDLNELNEFFKKPGGGFDKLSFLKKALRLKLPGLRKLKPLASKGATVTTVGTTAAGAVKPKDDRTQALKKSEMLKKTY